MQNWTRKIPEKGKSGTQKGGKSVYFCVSRPLLAILASHVGSSPLGTRDSYKEPPLPIWCSVRFPLIPLEFNDVLSKI